MSTLPKDKFGSKIDDNTLMSIAGGDLDNYDVVNKFGHNELVSTVITDIWDAGAVAGSRELQHLDVGVKLQITSANCQDALAGTGAKRLKISGLDGNYDEVEETITLNGFNQVPTVNEYLRVHRMQVTSAGASGWNTGDIYSFTGSASAVGVPSSLTTIQAKILFDTTINSDRGLNQTMMAVYTVPAGKTAFMSDFYYGLKAVKALEMYLCARPLGEVFQIKGRYMIADNTTINNMQKVRFDEKTDIVIKGQMDTGTGDVTAGFTLVLRDN